TFFMVMKPDGDGLIHFQVEMDCVFPRLGEAMIIQNAQKPPSLRSPVCSYTRSMVFKPVGSRSGQ
ncbi:MAG TPA: hypothetical protein VK829_19450, partial [Terriglobales bacterium]|nr:hypothetical protein [Terriglobales bacterium]